MVGCLLKKKKKYYVFRFLLQKKFQWVKFQLRKVDRWWLGVQILQIGVCRLSVFLTQLRNE